MNKKLFFLTAGFVALVAVIGFGLGILVAYSFNNTPSLKAASNIEQPVLSKPAEVEKSPFVNVAKKSMDAVVNISAERVITVSSPLSQLFQDPIFKQFLPPQKIKRKSLGSGFIVDILVIT